MNQLKIDQILSNLKNQILNVKNDKNYYFDANLFVNTDLRNQYNPGFLYGTDLGFVKKLNQNILVHFSSVNISDYLNNKSLKTNLVCSTYFLDSDCEFDFKNQNFTKKINSLYGGKILILSIDSNFNSDIFMEQSENKAGLDMDKFILDINSNLINSKSNNVLFKELSFNNLLYKTTKGPAVLDSKPVSNMIKLLHDSNKNGYKVFFFFKKTLWFQVLFTLSKYNIYVSGGNPTKRHMLSPVQLLLSVFVSCLDRSYLGNIKRSFSSELLISKKSYLDLKNFAFFKENYNFDHNVINLLFMYFYFVDMVIFVEKSLSEYVKKYPNFLSEKGISSISLSKTDNDYSNYHTPSGTSMYRYLKVNTPLDCYIPYSDIKKVVVLFYVPLFMKMLDRIDLKINMKDYPDYEYLTALLALCSQVGKNLLLIEPYVYDILEILVSDQKLNKDQLNVYKDKFLKLDIKHKDFLAKSIINNPNDVFKTNRNLEYLINSKINNIIIKDKYRHLPYKERQEKLKDLGLYGRGYSTSAYSGYNISLDNHTYNGLKTPSSPLDAKILYNTDVRPAGREGSVFKNNSIYNVNSPVYRDLLTTLVTKDLNEETQIQIERYLKNQYQVSVLTKNNLNTDIKYNILSPLLLNIINKSKELLDIMIINYKKQNNIDIENNLIFKVLNSCPNEFIINIILGRFLRIISNNGRLNSNTLLVDVGLDLGEEMVNQYIYNTYIINKKLTLNEWKKGNKDYIVKLEDPSFRTAIGGILIDWLRELKLLEIKTAILSRTEKNNYLAAHPRVSVLLPNDNNNLIYHLPNKIPMIVPPKPFMIDSESGKEKLGGYLLNDIEYTEPLILKNWELSKESKILNENIIYKAINNLSSVSFKINEKVLDFIFDNYKNYNLIIDPNYIHPLSLKSKLNKDEKTDLESFYSKKTLEQNILGLANIFREVPKFYIPVRIDYRGRFYCMSEYLNYQGVELAKSLLSFSATEKVEISDTNSINYLKIFGANCYGNTIEKSSFNDRIKWISENEENIINFRNGKLITKAKDKLLFIAFCFEYEKYIKAINNNNNVFETNLPLQFDATCNGFQHLTLLLNDLTLSSQLNLEDSNWNDMPKDFYSYVALKISNYFKSQLNNKNLSKSQKDSYIKLAYLGTYRNLVKKSIMTIPYNVSSASIISYMKEEFNKDKKNSYIFKNDANIVFNEEDFKNLRKALIIVLYEDYPKLKNLVQYFKDIAKISNKLGIQIPWYLPNGLIVQQQYYSSTTIQVKPFSYSKNLLNLTIPDKNNFNSRKQIRAFMPNFIHSLDAASLSLVIDNFFKYNDKFYAVHDCFAVTCNNVELITDFLKSAYCVIYTEENYLLKFNNNFLDIIKEYFGNDCYNPETNIIQIDNNNSKVILKYPDIKNIINNNILRFKNSSYIIH